MAVFALSVVILGQSRCSTGMSTRHILTTTQTNIGNARLAGLEKDLDIQGFDYNITLIIFFISYAGAEPITNLILKRLSPHVFFTAIMLLWGLMMVREL